jgi:hypothetical protein
MGICQLRRSAAERRSRFRSPYPYQQALMDPNSMKKPKCPGREMRRLRGQHNQRFTREGHEARCTAVPFPIDEQGNTAQPESQRKRPSQSSNHRGSDRALPRRTDGATIVRTALSLCGNGFQNGEVRSPAVFSYWRICAILPRYDRSLVAGTWRIASGLGARRLRWIDPRNVAAWLCKMWHSAVLRNYRSTL